MKLKSDEVFEKIPGRLAKIDPNNRKVLHIFKFNITVNGKVAKTWILDLKNIKLFEGDAPGVECTVICDDEIMYAMGTGKLKAMEAMAQDKLDVEGNLELVYLLEPFVSSL